MDKSWMTIKNRITSKEYREGVNSFLEFARANVGLGDDIWCPCVDCMNVKKQSTSDVKIHLILKGISPSYKTWIRLGESVHVHEPRVSSEDALPHRESITDRVEGNDLEDRDELPNMLEELYRDMFVDDVDDLADSLEREHVGNFDKLFDDAQQPLFPVCKSFTVLSFVVKVLHIKVHNKWSNYSFNMNMKVVKELLTQWNETVPILVEDPIATPLRRLDIDAEIIPQEVVFQSSGREQAGGSDDDDFICDGEDESEDEQSDEEGEMISTDSDTDPDIDWSLNSFLL